MTKRDRGTAVYHARSTKRGGRESCVWQQGWTLRRRQQNWIVRTGKSETGV